MTESQFICIKVTGHLDYFNLMTIINKLLWMFLYIYFDACAYAFLLDMHIGMKMAKSLGMEIYSSFSGCNT